MKTADILFQRSNQSPVIPLFRTNCRQFIDPYAKKSSIRKEIL